MRTVTTRRQALRRNIVQLGGYGLAGLTVNAAGFAAYVFLTSEGMGPKTAMTLVYALGSVIGFFSCRALVFSHSGALASVIALRPKGLS